MKNLVLLLVFFTCYNCEKSKSSEVHTEEEKPLLSIVNENGLALKTKPEFSEEIKAWQELNAVDNFIIRFKKASPIEVLNNAKELVVLTQALKDSLKPNLFNEVSLDARINILHNETLRLSDMNTIPAITAEEVNVQIGKIIETFSGVNSKINSVLLKKKFQEAIELDGDYIGLDSTKIDSVSKKAMLEKKKPKEFSYKKGM